MFFDKNQPIPDYEFFTIFDTKVGTYRLPMLALNRHDILRQLNSLFTDPQQARNELLINAEDFQLFKIGSYDKKTGLISGSQPEHIANLHEIRSAVQRSTSNAAPNLAKNIAELTQ